MSEFKISRSNNIIPLNKKTRIIPKNKTTLLGTHSSILDNDLDKSCLFEFSESLIRVEYPGLVINLDKAIHTLGGLYQIQKSVEGKYKLELTFHPNNKFSKSCVADKDNNIGLLIKIKQNQNSYKCEYAISDASTLNYKFNKMCDFQYLPVASKDIPEHEETEVNYLHDKILSEEIPHLEWFTYTDVDQQPFLTASCFARFDIPQYRLQLNSSEVFSSMVRPDLPKLEYSYRIRKSKKQKAVSSVQVSFLKPDVKVPHEPLVAALERIKEKLLQKYYMEALSLFNKRPIWKKASIMFKTGMNDDQTKSVLPAVAYYCVNGPWRRGWIRFGYNPTKDYNSRIYQTLDYRIRTSEGMKLKVKPKRGTQSHFFDEKYGHPTSYLKCQLVEEKSYILRPNYIPPARQMFYQYCDLLIPEIQEMLSKLPKLPPAVRYDCKNGWLPLSFTEHCRETVNKYVMDRVQKELLKETKTQEEMSKYTNQESSKYVPNYYSKMLSNIRKGIYQSINIQEDGESSKSNERMLETEDLQIEYGHGNADLEQIDADEIVGTLPERLSENSEDESDLEIDMETVEEVNEMVTEIQDNINQNIIND